MASLHLLALGAVLIAERIVVIRVPYWRFLFSYRSDFHLCSHVSCLVSLTIQAVLGNDPFTQKSFRSMDGEILKNSWVDFTLSRYSQLELKPCEHRSLDMDEFVVLVAETCVVSCFVLSNHTTVSQGIDERTPNELTASALVICAQS